MSARWSAGPRDGYVYVGARPFFRIVPKHRCLPEAMTRSKGDVFLKNKGEKFELLCDRSPIINMKGGLPEYTRYTSSMARLVAAKFDPAGRFSPIPEADGSFTLEFTPEDIEFVKLLCDMRDPNYRNTSAFERRIIHWGTQDWSGLTIEVRRDESKVYRCDVDIFGPEDTAQLNGVVYLYAVSMDPVKYEAKYGDERRAPALSVLGAPTAGAPRESQQYEPPTNAKAIGRCRTCGTDLLLDQSMMAIVKSQGGIVLVPCTGCRKGSMVKVFSPAERERRGIFAEVFEIPTQRPF